MYKKVLHSVELTYMKYFLYYIKKKFKLLVWETLYLKIQLLVFIPHYFFFLTPCQMEYQHLFCLRFGAPKNNRRGIFILNKQKRTSLNLSKWWSLILWCISKFWQSYFFFLLNIFQRRTLMTFGIGFFYLFDYPNSCSLVISCGESI